MADFISNFYRDPSTGMPVRFIQRGTYHINPTNLTMYYTKEVWNPDMSRLIVSHGGLRYTDSAERRKAWADTKLVDLIALGIEDVNQMITLSVHSTILKREGLIEEDQIILPSE